MQELSINELMYIDGGNWLGNLLITIGATIITIGTVGTAGIVASVTIGVVAYIGSN